MIDTTIQGYQSMVSAHGVDIVDINDFERLLQEPSVNYLDLYFSNDEILAAGSGATRAQRLAGKFAVKEAVMKALGTGWGNGVNFRDVEVVTLLSGEPKILLHRKLASIIQEKAITSWLVSISHTSTLAMASVIGIGEQS
jgi:holo-[acyl-carrier protein] synthase